jgi:uncharacterized membrane protein YdbT with pleckstrin-like domain
MFLVAGPRHVIFCLIKAQKFAEGSRTFFDVQQKNTKAMPQSSKSGIIFVIIVLVGLAVTAWIFWDLLMFVIQGSHKTQTVALKEPTRNREY